MAGPDKRVRENWSNLDVGNRTNLVRRLFSGKTSKAEVALAGASVGKL